MAWIIDLYDVKLGRPISDTFSIFFYLFRVLQNNFQDTQGDERGIYVRQERTIGWLVAS